MMRKLTSAFLALAALVLAWSGLSLPATAQGGDTMESASPVVLTDEVILTDGIAEYALGLHLEILEDPDGRLTIEQVASPEYSEQFVPSQDKAPNLGYTDSAYWVRFRARNETAETHDWRLELGFANIQHVALYTPLAQSGNLESGFAVKQTGTSHPFSTRDVAFHHIVFNLSLPIQAEQTFYLRFQNDASMTLPLTLWSAAAFAQHSRSDMFMWGILYGVLLIMLGHNAFLFLSLRDRNYLYCALFLGDFLLFQASFAGHAQQYLWPDVVAWNRVSVLPFTTALPMMALLFTASFLELRAHAPRLNRALTALLVVLGLVLLLTPFVRYSLIVRPIVVLAIGSFLLMMVSGFALWRRGYRPAGFFTLSWTAFLVSIILLGLARYGLMPSTTLTEQGYLVGTVLTVLLLTLALADRIKLLEAEAEQASREVQASESRLHQYLEAMPVGVTVRGADSRLRYVNRRARQLLNWPDEPPGEMPSRERTLQEMLEEAPLYVRGTQQAYPLERLPSARAMEGEPGAVDDVEMERGGQRIPLEIWSSPVLDEQGRVQYAVSAFRDVSRRVEAEARIRNRLAVEKSLAHISTLFVQAADLDQAMSETLAEVGPLLGFDRLFLVRIRPDRSRMEMTHEWCAAGLPSLFPEVRGVPLADVPWLLDKLRSGDIVYVEDASELPPEARLEARFIAAHLGGRRCVLPVWVGRELDGFLACQSHSTTSPNLENEVQVLETVIGMLSSALQQASVLETLERRVADRTQELSTLYRVTTLTSTAQPLETILIRSLEVVLAALDRPMGAIHLRADRTSPLRLVARQGLPAEAIDELATAPPQEMWWQQVLAQDRLLLLVEDSCDEPSSPPWACLAEIQAYLGVPIRVEGEPAGVLSIFGETDHAFTAEEMALLTTIADQLGTAIEGDRLRRHAEETRVIQERQRLARDLHDAVTQSLYSLTLFARAAREMLQGGKTDRADQHLERIGEMAHYALKEMRLLIYQLRPSALEAEGLVGALEQRLEAVERRAGMDARLVADGGSPGLPPQVEEALYRIAQEILNNVLKHAAATQVAISLDVGNGAVELAVRDNGQGFDLETGRAAGGMGLANIRQRVEMLGGTLTITSKPGQGTELRANVPVTWRQEFEGEVPG
jgi:signal transduction histidine kinase/PAS domain-containing protein